MSALAFDIADDPFAVAFGARRGTPRVAAPRLIVSGREAVADEELGRLMELAVAGRFTEPLRVLRACADQLEAHPASKADVLCMCTATQMVERSRRFTVGLAFGLGWHPGAAYALAFAAGMRSKMGQTLEGLLTDCPPEDWQEWLTLQWRERFEGLLAARLASESTGSAIRLLGHRETCERSEPIPTDLSVWQRVAHTALHVPREHLLRPLGRRSVIVCRQAAADTLRAART